MIPVYQDKFQNPSNESTGDANCLMACVASILERPLHEIPDFSMTGIGWFEDLHEWCINEEIGLLHLSAKNLDHSLVLNAYCILIFSVKNSTVRHAVVGKTRLDEKVHFLDDAMEWTWRAEVVHDPNSFGVKIDVLEDVVFLLPLPRQTTDNAPKPLTFREAVGGECTVNG